MAVGQVVRNRVDSKYFPNDYKKVIYQKNQFAGVTTSMFNVGTVPEECVRAAKEVITRTEEYCMPSNIMFFKTTDCKANWSYEFYKTIGDHNFYKYGEE